MTALSLLALLALLLGPSALLAARQSISASKSLAPAICAQALFLYAVGLALPMGFMRWRPAPSPAGRGPRSMPCGTCGALFAHF